MLGIKTNTVTEWQAVNQGVNQWLLTHVTGVNTIGPYRLGSRCNTYSTHRTLEHTCRAQSNVPYEYKLTAELIVSLLICTAVVPSFNK